MISGAFKKLAEENGMKVAQGVAYGSFRGYSAAFWDGSGTKSMMLSTKFEDDGEKNEFLSRLQGHDLQKEFRIRDIQVMDMGILVEFLDTVGTMKRINEFFDFIFPLLDNCGATRSDVCFCCGQQLDGTAQWTLLNGVPMKMHRACRDRMISDEQREQAVERENDTGSYGSGLVGALLGSIVGALVWALIFLLGRISVIGGLIIALLAGKGYDLMHGKKGKGKIAIVLVMSILGVVLGTFGGYFAEIVKEIVSGGFPGYTIAQAPGMIVTLLTLSEEFCSEFVRNLGLGFLFAALGIYMELKNEHRQLKGMSVKELP